MKAHYQAGRCLLRPLTVLVILTVMPLLAAHAADPQQGGISKDDLDKALRAGQDKMNAALVIGTWKNADLHTTMTFSETGEFEFRGESKVEKGLYKVAASGDGVLVSVFFSQGKDYFSVTPLSKDRAAWTELKSPTAKPDPERAVVWTRGAAGPERAETSPPPNAKGKELFDLQSPRNLIGNWKSAAADGLVTTMSFSERGEFNYAKEKDGKRQDVVKAAYTAEATGGGLLVTIVDGNEKAYYGIAFLSKNRCFKQLLKSPDDPIDANKAGMILNREP